MKNYSIKQATNILKINYSTAKTILKVFREERRSIKKNIVKDNSLIDLVNTFHKEEMNKDCNYPKMINKDFAIEEADSKGISNNLIEMVDSVNKCLGSFQINKSIIDDLMSISFQLKSEMNKKIVN